MAMKQRGILIVGCGPGAAASITPEARIAVQQAGVLVGAQRLLQLFCDVSAQRVAVRGEVSATIEAIDRYRSHGVALLVTGDPGIASLARKVIEHFGRSACQVIPGLSSVQVAFARLGVDWMDARIVSAHGSAPAIGLRDLQGESKIAVLLGSQPSLDWAAELCGHLGPDWRRFVAENLTLANERVYECSVDLLRTGQVAPLSVLVLVRKDCL